MGEFGGGWTEVPRYYPPVVRPEVVRPEDLDERPEAVWQPAELHQRPEAVRQPAELPAELREQPEVVEQPKPASDVEATRRDHRIEVAHAERISEARGEHGIVGQIKDFVHNVVTQVIERVAFVAANHIAPGIGGHIVNWAVEFKKGIDSIENLSRNGTIELQIPVATGADGMFGLWVGPTISENEKGQAAIGIGVGPAVGIYEPLEVGSPDIEVTAPDDDHGVSNTSVNAYREVKTADPPDPATSEIRLPKTEITKPQDESTLRHSNPSVSGSDIPREQFERQKSPKQQFIETYKASLERINPEDKASSFHTEVRGAHDVRDNSPREKLASPASEIRPPAVEGRNTSSLTESFLSFDTGFKITTGSMSTIGSSRGSTTGSTGTSAGASKAHGRAGVSKVMGVVVWGSATDIAAWANTPILSDQVLLRYVKMRIFDDVYDGTAISVARYRKAVRTLEVIIFLDTVTGTGLWVDVDPKTQDPAATLLIKVDPKNRFRPVRFFRYGA